MYAIRSYYVKPIISRLQHVRITQQIEVAKNPAIAAVKDTVVITSYSIHYTKLYEWRY